MKTIILAALFILLGLGLSGNAQAYTQVTLGHSGEPALQTILDTHVSGGTIQAYGDQSDEGHWHSAGLDINIYLLDGYRGDKGTLGIYSLTNGSIQTLTFSDFISLSLTSAGALSVNGVLVNADFGTTFGFFWADTTVPLTSYTDDGKNALNTGYGLNNTLALRYLVGDGLSVAVGGDTLQALGDDDWILAFEDRSRIGGGDGDFNDAVFYVENMVPAPEPGTLALMLGGGGLLAYVGLRRRPARRRD